MFVENPTNPPDTQCIQDLPGIAFDVPDQQKTEVTMLPITVDSKGIKSVAPENWSEIQPGLFVRGSSALDQTLIIFDVVPNQAPEVFVPGLLQFLNIDEFPGESTSTLECNGIEWNLYRTKSTVNGLDIYPAAALGQDAQNAYVVVLMVGAEESDWLYDSAFLPAVEALEPIK
jgi:hypothetical protein